MELCLDPQHQALWHTAVLYKCRCMSDHPDGIEEGGAGFLLLCPRDGERRGQKQVLQTAKSWEAVQVIFGCNKRMTRETRELTASRETGHQAFFNLQISCELHGPTWLPFSPGLQGTLVKSDHRDQYVFNSIILQVWKLSPVKTKLVPGHSCRDRGQLQEPEFSMLNLMLFEILIALH